MCAPSEFEAVWSWTGFQELSLSPRTTWDGRSCAKLAQVYQESPGPLFHNPHDHHRDRDLSELVHVDIATFTNYLLHWVANWLIRKAAASQTHLRAKKIEQEGGRCNELHSLPLQSNSAIWLPTKAQTDLLALNSIHIQYDRISHCDMKGPVEQAIFDKNIKSSFICMEKWKFKSVHLAC